MDETGSEISAGADAYICSGSTGYGRDKSS